MTKRYEIVLTDFPWTYTKFGTAKLTYKQMTEEEISNFDWSLFLAKDAIVFSWVTCPKLDLALRCGERWKKQGLIYQGVAFVWVKTKLDGTPLKASGVRPRTVKPLTEFCLVYSTKDKRVFPLLSEKIVQTVFAPKPLPGKHSTKPPEVRDRIVELLGDRPRIELFARGKIPEGWDGHGDEYDPG